MADFDSDEQSHMSARFCRKDNLCRTMVRRRHRVPGPREGPDRSIRPASGEVEVVPRVVVYGRGDLGGFGINLEHSSDFAWLAEVGAFLHLSDRS
jgi:hypothetical protein